MMSQVVVPGQSKQSPKLTKLLFWSARFLETVVIGAVMVACHVVAWNQLAVKLWRAVRAGTWQRSMDEPKGALSGQPAAYRALGAC